MKKLISLLLVMVMLLSCSLCLAEESANASEATEGAGSKENLIGKADEFTATLPGKVTFDMTPKKDKFALTTTDVVTVSGSNNIVKTAEGIILLMDVPTGYTCLTQDFQASIFSFIAWEDPDGLIDAMINSNTHLLLFNDLDSSLVCVRTLGGDPVSTRVGNLNTLSQSRAVEYANAFAASQDLVYTDIITAGENTWMRFEDTILVTVVGGNYIVVTWESGSEAEFNEDNLADLTELLSHLTIFA